jgi:hypothetical protein
VFLICRISGPRIRHPAFVSLVFFLVRFWAFLGEGGPKKTIVRSESRKLFPEIRQKKPMPVPPRLLLFYRVFGCFSATGVQKHHKRRTAKKFLQKARSKIKNRPPYVPEI